MKTIGIIGGMGPQATLRLYELLIRRVTTTRPNAANADFPHLLISNLPVPDLITSKRSEKITVSMVIREGRRLCDAGADFLILPCNTMHLYMRDYLAAFRCPFVSMVELVARRIDSEGVRKVAVLGTPTTTRNDMYGRALDRTIKNRKIKVLYPSKRDQESTVGMIDACIAGKVTRAHRAGLMEIVQRLRKRGAQRVILACTELPLLLPKRPPPHVLDTLAVLAEGAYAYAAADVA